MKLSSRTVSILKNFSGIFPNLLVKPGNIIATNPLTGNILSRATLVESFPKQFAIYDLPNFMGVISIFKDPEVEFGDREVKLTEDDTQIVYSYAAETEVIQPRLEGIPMTADLSFSLPAKVLKSMGKAAGTLGLDGVSFVGQAGELSVHLMKMEKSTNNRFTVKLGETDKTFRFVYKGSNVAMILEQDYDVEIEMKRGVLHFKSPDLEYWIPAEAA